MDRLRANVARLHRAKLIQPEQDVLELVVAMLGVALPPEIQQLTERHGFKLTGGDEFALRDLRLTQLAEVFGEFRVGRMSRLAHLIPILILIGNPELRATLYSYVNASREFHMTPYIKLQV